MSTSRLLSGLLVVTIALHVLPHCQKNPQKRLAQHLPSHLEKALTIKRHLDVSTIGDEQLAFELEHSADAIQEFESCGFAIGGDEDAKAMVAHLKEHLGVAVWPDSSFRRWRHGGKDLYLFTNLSGTASWLLILGY